MKIELPSADHRLLLYDRGENSVERFKPDFVLYPFCRFPGWDACASIGPLFDLIGEVHGEEAQVAASCQPLVWALDVWPMYRRRLGTALLRRRWGIPEIAWVSVAKSVRRRDLGSAMVRDLLQRCNTRYVCAVTSDPSVVPFWEKCGFHVAEEIPDA